MSSRRRAVTFSTVRRPSSVNCRSVSRRLAGFARRSASPAAISRSTIRIAVDGATCNCSASMTSLVAPRVESTTSIRNWASVTRSSTSARDRADTATSSRDAVSTARVTASTSSRPSVRGPLPLSAMRPPRGVDTRQYEVDAGQELRPVVMFGQFRGHLPQERVASGVKFLPPGGDSAEERRAVGRAREHETGVRGVLCGGPEYVVQQR